MDKNSTQFPQMATAENKAVKQGPKKSTINFLRQFARVYMPVGNMPGLVMN